jgi:hypothetical protein
VEGVGSMRWDWIEFVMVMSLVAARSTE